MDSFSIDVIELRRPDCIHRLQVHWWNTIKDIKMKLYDITMVPPAGQHIYQSTKATELKNSWTLHDMGIVDNGMILRVAIDYSTRLPFTLSLANNVDVDEACTKMINEVKQGFQKNKAPTSTDGFQGSGGVYFLRGARNQYVAVFKPHDEEQGMPNNPKDHAGTGIVGMREFFHPGEGCLRELAAYIMDVSNFCHVPPTTLVHCEHPAFNHPSKKVLGGQGDPFPKLGSLQRFVGGSNNETFEDIGPSLLSDFEVQKIALFDMRVLNCDRNASNIIVIQSQHTNDSDQECSSGHNSSGSGEYDIMDSSGGAYDFYSPTYSSHNNSSRYELIPIDHGYCMPSKLSISEMDWVWYTCSHIAKPVHPEIKAYLQSLDIDDLLLKLKKQATISEDCLFLLEVVHYLLINGVEDGLTLKDIATLIVRLDDGINIPQPSRLELAIQEAEENAYRAIEVRHNRNKSLGSPHESLKITIPTNNGSSNGQIFSLANSPVDDYHKHGKCNNRDTSVLVKSKLTTMMVADAQDDLTTVIPTDGLNGSISIISSMPKPLDPIRERGISDLSNGSDGCTTNSDYCINFSDSHMDVNSECNNLIEDEQSKLLYGPPIESLPGQPIKWIATFGSPSNPLPSPSNNKQTTHHNNHMLEGKPLRSLMSVADDGRTMILSKPSISPTKTTSTSSEGSNEYNPTYKHSLSTEIGVTTTNGNGSVTAGVSKCRSNQSPDSAIVLPSPAVNVNIPLSNTSLHVHGHSGEYSQLVDMDQEEEDTSITSIRQSPRLQALHSDGVTGSGSNGSLAHLLSTPTHHHNGSSGSGNLKDEELCEAPSLVRVTTFSGFDSTPLYHNSSARAMGNLKLERRRTIAITEEFQILRRQFAKDAVKSILGRLNNKNKRIRGSENVNLHDILETTHAKTQTVY